MKNKFIISIIVCLLSGNIFPQSYIPNEEFLNTIHRHLRFLGSDLFEGRGTGDTGGYLAAKYLALEFSKLRLKPIGENNTYYQHVPMHGSMPLKESKLKIHTRDSIVNLNITDDYLLFNSGEHTLIPLPVDLVFVGYGIVAPEFDYNDYQNVDVEGKIVVMLDGEPNSDDDTYFSGNNPTLYSYPESKQRLAIAQGATGSIIIPALSSGHTDWAKYKNMFSFEDIKLSYSASKNLALMINPQKADVLFKDSGYHLEDIYKMRETNNIKSFELNTKLSFDGVYRQRDFLASNIVGMIEGSDPELKDSYLIISAHYDHLGLGPAVEGDSIYNGVFDNAIGVAAILELAREINKLETPPARSVIFIAFTGEEEGLLGSTYYTDYPIVPLYKTVANINVDGVAVFDTFKSVIGIGREYSTLSGYLEKTADEFNLSIVDIPPQFYNTETFNRSDQIAFAFAGVPAMLVLDGPDYVHMSRAEGIQKQIEYNSKIYHTPFDDLSLPVNFSAVYEHVQFLYSLCLNIANDKGQPEWYRGSPYSAARLRSIAEKR